MKIAVYGRNIESSINKFINVIGQIEANGNELCVYKPFADFLCADAKFKCNQFPTFTDCNALSENTMLATLGGDGTFLEAAHFLHGKNVPLIGINTGTLGFLSGVSINKVDSVLNEIKHNDYKIENRTLLTVCTDSENKISAQALNEISLQRTKPALITSAVFVNGEPLAEYRSDGLIVATPTGSTAYSMSVGGPIVAPTVQSFVISPIAPHNLSMRPIVISDDVEIKVKILTRGENAILAADNQMFEIKPNTEIKIKKSPFVVKMIKPNSVNFYNTLKNKLMWGYDPRNETNINL